MEIELPMDEYFKELKFMYNQYGQEEGLYPWIFILLQKVKCSVKNISIIDVHKAQSIKGLQGEREKFMGKTSFPDFVFCDNEGKVQGCVEIKGLNIIKDKSNDIDVYEPLVSVSKESLEMIYTLGKDLEKRKVLKPKKYSRIEKILNEKSTIPVGKIKEEELCWQTENQKHFLKYGDNESIEFADEFDIKEPRVEEKWYFETDPPEFLGLKSYHDQYEIIGHLEKFRNVLLTNGIEFYWLTYDENKTTIGKKEIIINVNKIVDGSKQFRKYLNNEQLNEGSENIWHKELKNLGDKLQSLIIK